MTDEEIIKQIRIVMAENLSHDGFWEWDSGGLVTVDPTRGSRTYYKAADLDKRYLFQIKFLKLYEDPLGKHFTINVYHKEEFLGEVEEFVKGFSNHQKILFQRMLLEWI